MDPNIPRIYIYAHWFGNLKKIVFAIIVLLNFEHSKKVIFAIQFLYIV